MEPVLAECLDDSRPARPSRSVFAYVFWGLAFLVFATAAALLAVRATRTTPAPVSRLTYSAPPFSVDEVRKLIPQLFDGRMHVEPEQHSDIRSFLSRIAADPLTEDEPSSSTLIDWPAQIGQFLAAVGSPADEQRAELTMGRYDVFKLPENRFEFQLADVRSYGDRDLLVATYAKRYGDVDSILFHLRRDGSTLRVADWWNVENQNWRANIDGPLNASNAARFDDHGRFEELCREANAARAEGRKEAVRERLFEVEKLPHPPSNRDWRMMLLATHWVASESDDEAARVLNSVADRGAFPSVERIWAGIHLRAGRFAEALEATNAYERQLGFSVDVLRDRLNAAKELGRNDIVLDSAKRLFAFDPDDQATVRTVLQEGPEDLFAQLVADLPRSDETCRRFTGILSNMLYGSSADNVPSIRDALVETYGEDHIDILRLDARIAHHDGRLEEALAIQSQVIDRLPPGDVSRKTNLWTWAEIGLGFMTPRQVYDAWPDKPEILRVMWRDDEDPDEGGLLEVEQLAELLVEHRRLAPDDPSLLEYEAAVAMHEGRDRDALQAYQSLLAAARQAIAETSAAESEKAAEGSESEDEIDPEERVGEFESLILSLRFQLGEGLPAYREATTPATAFRQLAERYVDAKDAGGLRELIAAHSHRSAGDPWLSFYLCRLDEWELRPDSPPDAWRALEARYRELADRDPPPEMRYRITERLREVALGAPDLAKRLAGPTVLEWPFLTVVRELETRDDPALLDTYLRNLRDQNKQADSLAEYEVDAAWERRDYVKVLEGLDVLAESENRNSYRIPWDDERRFLSLMHLGRHDEARDMPRRVAAPHLDLFFEVSQGDPQKVPAILEPLEEIPQGPLFRAHERKPFPRVDEYLASDDWRAMTHDKPFATNWTISTYDYLLLRETPKEWSADSLAETLQAANLPEVRVTEVPDAIETQKSFLVATQTDVFIVTVGTRPLEDRKSLAKLGSTPATAHLRSLADHQAWIAISRHNASQSDRRTHSGPIAAALADEQTLGVATWFAQWQPFVSDSNPEFWERCRASKPISNRGGSWVQLTADPVRGAAGETQNAFSPRHRARCAAVVAGDPPGRATIVLRHGFAAERLEVDVASVRHTGWGEYEIEVRLLSDSRYQPHLRQGSLSKIRATSIIDWQ